MIKENRMKASIVFILSAINFCCFGQNKGLISSPHGAVGIVRSLNHQDTTLEADTSKENKEPRYFYITVNANTYVNTTGSFRKRFSPSVEVGRTYGIFDIGLAAGKLNIAGSGSDTTSFLEFRPTINVFSKGRFSESLFLGAGYVFNAKERMLTEICNNINFNISEKVAVSVAQAYIFFDGVNSHRNSQYMGFNLTYNLLKPHSVNKERKKKAIVSGN